MAGSLSHRTLAPGSILWGMGFTPFIGQPTYDADGFAADPGGKAVGETIPLNGPLAAGSGPYYLPGACALHFNYGTNSNTVTYRIVGLDQFGDEVTEDLAMAAATNDAYTSHRFSRVDSVTVQSGSLAAGDAFTIGFTYNNDIDCPIPVPFRIKNADHIQAISLQGEVYTGSDISVSTVYNTVTLKNAATNIGSGTDGLMMVQFMLTPGAANLY